MDRRTTWFLVSRGHVTKNGWTRLFALAYLSENVCLTEKHSCCWKRSATRSNFWIRLRIRSVIWRRWWALARFRSGQQQRRRELFLFLVISGSRPGVCSDRKESHRRAESWKSVPEENARGGWRSARRGGPVLSVERTLFLPIRWCPLKKWSGSWMKLKTPSNTKG